MLTTSFDRADVDYDFHQGDLVGTTFKETLRYWPALSERRKPEWMLEHGIDAKKVDALDATMIELYGALDNDLRMLSAIGIRTSFDIASELLGVDPTLSFNKKLDALVAGDQISVVDKDRLEMLVDAGSASVHRGWRPTPKELGTMMDVLEHFVQEFFVAPTRKAKLDEEAAEVKKSVPRKASPPDKLKKPKDAAT